MQLKEVVEEAPEESVRKLVEVVEPEELMASSRQLVEVEVSCLLAVEALSRILMRQDVDRSSTESCEGSQLKEQKLRY